MSKAGKSDIDSPQTEFESLHDEKKETLVSERPFFVQRPRGHHVIDSAFYLVIYTLFVRQL